MHIRKLTVVAVTALAGALACSHESKPAAVGYRSMEAPTTMAVAPADTSFRVTTTDSLSSENAYPGKTFTAVLTQQIWSTDGRVIAQPGSEVRGHVVAVASGPEPRLAVTFDSIATRGGPALFDVRVADALNAPFAIASMRRPDEVDADLVARPSDQAIGGGPAAEGSQGPTRAAVIPKNSELELVLTVPLSIALPR
jgi:hypothetical protein